MTPEEYIKAYTRGNSNELVHGGYHEWLTPENALAAVELARKEKLKEPAGPAIVATCGGRSHGKQAAIKQAAIDNLEQEIDRYWCSLFTDTKLKRNPNTRSRDIFIPDPPYNERGARIGYALCIDWKDEHDCEGMTLSPGFIRGLARHFAEWGATYQASPIYVSSQDLEPKNKV